MDQKRFAGILGAALMVVGLFAPIFGSPLKGQVTYFDYNQTEGTVVLVLAFVALFLAAVRWYQAMLFVGMAALATLALTFIKFQLFTSGADTQWLKKFADSPFEGINRMVQQTFTLEWGWGLLIAGAVLIIAAGNLKGYSRR